MVICQVKGQCSNDEISFYLRTHSAWQNSVTVLNFLHKDYICTEIGHITLLFCKGQLRMLPS